MLKDYFSYLGTPLKVEPPFTAEPHYVCGRLRSHYEAIMDALRSVEKDVRGPNENALTPKF